MKSFSNIWGTIISKFKRYGFFGVISRILTYTLSQFGIEYTKFLIYQKLLKSELLRTESEQQQFSKLSISDFENQQKLNPSWFNAEKISSIRLAFAIKGTTAYGLFEGDLLISYGFLSTSSLGLNNKIQLIENDCYLWDAYTHPCARGRRLHKLLTIYIEREAYKMGKNRALVIVASFNKASSKTYERLGYKISQNYYYISYCS